MIDVRPDSENNRFRAERIALLRTLISSSLMEKPVCKILDIGGTFGFWKVWRDKIDWSCTEITCVNMDPTHADEGKEQTSVSMLNGDARHLPEIRSGDYDIVFSNSVIEHVGTWGDMQSMANEVKRIGRRYLVQTPYYWFPIEPHARMPFLHWLPESLAYRILMSRKCGFWLKAATVSDAVSTVQSARMLDFRQMKELFPDARIKRERFLGLTKSLLAVKC